MRTRTTADLAADVAASLPYLRRFARALVGSQTAGDACAAKTLEALIVDPAAIEGARSPKIALFRVFNAVWQAGGMQADVDDDGDARVRAARARLSALTPLAREAFLLRTLEDFDDAAIAEIMAMDPARATELADIGATEIAGAASGRVMIIEDEAIIAMDLRAIVSELGHDVIAIARTRDDARVKLGADTPDLVLADIQLADGSSGVDAVNDMLGRLGDIPVIFITAYPERLLTAERPEPAFLITKPFKEAQVRAAIDQALFFRSSAVIEV
ncbi:MAG: CheY-like chemotaxis protein/DNA-directed RNA polymerase specialized sigma24 family protein [Paracoccaceae bacterium]|jgi:CheY-like chemotaxis protein/DNA-directed RNA polymerase specialized sigma24 family protein